jgi:hypothetical protein
MEKSPSVQPMRQCRVFRRFCDVVNRDIDCRLGDLDLEGSIFTDYSPPDFFFNGNCASELRLQRLADSS